MSRSADIKKNNVYETNNLSQFKTLVGNRAVSEARIKTLVDSIKKNGYLHSPILVNERMEVIDGQGRLEACKKLKHSIEYIKVSGFGINECRVLNYKMNSWMLKDYVDSYAELGCTDYIRLKNLMKICSQINTVQFASTLYGARNVSNQNSIKEGRVVMSEETYMNTQKCLDWHARLEPTISQTKAHKKAISKALVFAYYDEACDNDRIEKQLRKYALEFPETITIDTTLHELSKIYNKGLKDNRVYLDADYTKHRDDQKALQ